MNDDDDDDDDDDNDGLVFFLRRIISSWHLQRSKVRQAFIDAFGEILYVGLGIYALPFPPLPPAVVTSKDHPIEIINDITTTPTSKPTIPTTTTTMVLQLGNGYLGLSQFAPFDILHVGAAFSYTLCQQLKVGGCMIIYPFMT